MPKPIRLSHAVLKTYDVSRMRDWYCAALEAHMVFELPGAPHTGQEISVDLLSRILRVAKIDRDDWIKA